MLKPISYTCKYADSTGIATPSIMQHGQRGSLGSFVALRARYAIYIVVCTGWWKQQPSKYVVGPLRTIQGVRGYDKSITSIDLTNAVYSVLVISLNELD